MNLANALISPFLFFTFLALAMLGTNAQAEQNHLAYIVSDSRIPFWRIMSSGIQQRADQLGYRVSVHSADNHAKRELELTVQVLREGVDGIILSPTNSSAAATVLKLAEQAGVPVVISDIGADADNYVSYIESDNAQGGYGLGVLLADALKGKGWDDGTVGIIAIPQKRANGKARTDGFMRALEDRDISAAALLQQSDFSYRETYEYSRVLITEHPDLRAIWLQGSNRYQAAMDAISDSGREGEILLICFDAEPEFIEMVAEGALVGAGMQQPYLMGEKAVDTMHRHLNGGGVEKNQRLSVLPVSSKNLHRLLPLIKRNVLGEESDH